VCLVLGGVFSLGSTEELILSVKSNKASPYWLTIRFYLALFSAFFLISSLAISVGVLQLIDDHFIKVTDKPFFLLGELFLFVWCIYTHRAVKQDQFDYVFCQALMLVAGNVIIMISLLFGYTITILECACFNLVFSTLSVIIGFWIQKPGRFKTYNFLLTLKKYFISPDAYQITQTYACETTKELSMAKVSMAYFTSYYFFLSYSKGLCWLHLYGELSHVLYFSPKSQLWLSTLLLLLWGVLAFKYLACTAKYTMLEKDLSINANRLSLILPIEIFLLTQKLLVPLVLIFLKSWDLHSQLSEARPRWQAWLKRLVKVLVNPAYCVLTNSDLASIYVLSVANPLDNAAK
jgi:hypothetical protein